MERSKHRRLYRNANPELAKSNSKMQLNSPEFSRLPNFADFYVLFLVPLR